MKAQKIFIVSTALLGALSLGYAYAGNPAYVNGGVGADEEAVMHRIAKEFPLRMEFSKGKDGAFAVDVAVTITDASNKVVFDLPNAGPMLDVRLPKGKYSIRAVSDHVTQSSDVVLDGKHQAKTVILHWGEAIKK